MAELAGRVEATDSVVKAIIERFCARSEVGKSKYGTDLDRSDLAVQDWITHAQEEFMDGILYLEKLRRELAAVAASLGPRK